MIPTTKPTSPLLPEWAFVVQFREGTDMEHDRMEGRVEHIVSGNATRLSTNGGIFSSRLISRSVSLSRPERPTFCVSHSESTISSNVSSFGNKRFAV